MGGQQWGGQQSVHLEIQKILETENLLKSSPARGLKLLWLLMNFQVTQDSLLDPDLRQVRGLVHKM